MKNRGFSLLEALITMGLVFVVLGLISVLIRDYGDMSRQSDARDATMDAVQFALRQMRNEVAGAVQIDGFNSTIPEGYEIDLGNALTFKKFDSARRADRLPRKGAIPPGYVDPWDPAFLRTVKYQTSGDSVVRIVDGGPPQMLVEKMNTFDVVQAGPSYLRFTLSFQEARRHRVYSLESRLWVKQP